MDPNRWAAWPSGADPHVLERDLHRAREQFLSTGAPAPVVRRLVLDSWRRSRRSGVDPDRAAPHLDLAGADLAAYRRTHPLAATIGAVRHLLLDALTPDGMVVAVGDADGRLLWIDGATATRSALDDVGFSEGANWAEDAAGTSAPGIALALEHEVQVYGAEHFASSIQPWSCTAAPIRDPRTGRPLGILDITGGPEVAAPHMLALIRATVAAVEAKLLGNGRDLARHAATGAPAAEPELRVLGRDRGTLRRRAGRVSLSRRHSEILVVLAGTDGLGAAELSAALYAEGTAEVTVRAEISRMRRALPGVLADGPPYRLRVPVRSDVDEVTDALTAGDLDGVLTAYRGPVLPASEAPGVATVRDDLAAAVRAAVLSSGSVEHLDRWTASPAGRDDWQAWERLRQRAWLGSPAHVRARLRLAALDAELGA